MADKKDDLKFYVLEKHEDREDIKSMSESELAKIPDPTKAEIFLKEEDAQKKKGEIAFARLQTAQRKRAAKAKVERQRAEFARANPEAAAQYRDATETALEKHLRAIQQSNGNVDADHRLDTSKLEAAIRKLKQPAST